MLTGLPAEQSGRSNPRPLSQPWPSSQQPAASSSPIPWPIHAFFPSRSLSRVHPPSTIRRPWPSMATAPTTPTAPTAPNHPIPSPIDRRPLRPSPIAALHITADSDAPDSCWPGLEHLRPPLNFPALLGGVLAKPPSAKAYAQHRNGEPPLVTFMGPMQAKRSRVNCKMPMPCIPVASTWKRGAPD